MIDLDIDISDLDRLKEAVGATEKIAELSMLSAMKRTQRWLSTQVTRQVAKAARLPSKAVRARVRLGRPTLRKLEARVWIGLDPIAAGRAGKPRATRAGVTVGKHKIAGAFVIRGKRVAKRTGATRFPIETVKIDIADIAERVLKHGAFDGAQEVLLNEFDRQMRFRMSRVG